ncbi:amidase family protein [Streptomyces sp. NPDC093109]|uniref:amidase family protein n=1 Tax=Streptomyces sp. NPDC093109 TaxID=3154977 RepID=UPI00344DDB08
MTEESSLGHLRGRLESGASSSLALARACVRRIMLLDRDGPRLNAVPVLSPTVFDDAAALDAERAAGRVRGPLHGIPYTVKDSFAAAGMTLAAGSPAFARVVARQDAVVVERLRRAGALLVGRTNMPPMAIGGGQAGLYGRTRSPYNPEHLAAAWHSGSSIGSGVSVAAGLCAFGIGEETVSSGRSPASNNALVAYTPSWGVVPSTGNWPLHPYRDVVVPHTRSVADLRDVLAVIAGGDPRDVWARQSAVDIAPAEAVSLALRAPAPSASTAALEGLVIGVPRLYAGEDGRDTGGPPLRPSIRRLWERTERTLLAAGVRTVHVDFPLVEAYEGRGTRHPSLEDRGYLPPDWTAYELDALMTFSWQRHLDAFARDPLPLTRVAPAAVRPDVPHSVDIVESGQLHPGRDVFDFARILSQDAPDEEEVLRRSAAALAGLDAARRDLFEDWMAREGLDAVVFPANSDVGSWDAETNPASARAAWRDGTVFSTTNHVLRRVGIPSVTVPMGVMDDIGMPVGLTVCGPAYTDHRLLGIAQAIEHVLPARAPAPLPRVPDLLPAAGAGRSAATRPVRARVSGDAVIAPDGSVKVRVRTEVAAPDGTRVLLEVCGQTREPGPGVREEEFRLAPARRTVHGETSALVLLTVAAPDSTVLTCALTELPYTRPRPT